MIKPNKSTKIVIILLSLLPLITCGKSIPVQAMDDARKQIDAATIENAQTHSAETYNQSREALLNAHKALADDNLGAAKENANKSIQYAQQARVVSAPKHIEKVSSLAKTNIEEADVAYAEALAPEDFAASKELYEEGQKLSASANELSSDKKQRGKMLYNYGEATRKFDASNQSSIKAKNLALSQKGDVLDSLQTVRSQLKKANIYGATAHDPDAVSSATAKLDDAETLINQDKLKGGYLKMKEAEKEANDILVLVEGSYAKKKLSEAKKYMGQSEQRFASANTKKNQSATNKKAILVTLEEQMGAAKEALGSSDDFFNEDKFSDSINESEEAIRLSQIIIEQSNIMGGISSRDANIITEEYADGDFKKYRVLSTKPADSLWGIARKKEHYGNGAKWKHIYRANKKTIKNPNLIFPGQVILIPVKKKEIQEEPKEEEVIKEEEKAEETPEVEKTEDSSQSEKDSETEKEDELEQPQENSN